MWLCTEWKIDWDAVAAVATASAAIIALIIWSYDKFQRKRERSASAKLLAQIMTTPVGATQVELAEFKRTLSSSNGDRSYLVDLLHNEEARKDLASKALQITIDLPSQFLDKADIFSEVVNNRLANAFSQVNRLKTASRLLGQLSDSADEEEVDKHVMAVLTQISEAEKATEEAFQALLKAGKSS
ncbi:hypothetical protein [Pseudomonas sp. PMCC200344]|uniref:hypothetical protein n=1 Tax=Pseudomonas sp. PMCC200344 TaxID=3042028 RepID=UPI0024B3AE4B|nr:hypothetical protein [Pseudomonas sp. PMCC200344]